MDTLVVAALPDDTLEAGDTLTLAATALDDAGIVIPAAAVSWRSSAPAVAGVVDGQLVSRTAGRARITATSGWIAASFEVEVVPRRVFTQLRTDERSACAVDEAGALFCWGSNFVGIVSSDAAVEWSDWPVRVPTARPVAHLASSDGNHTCIADTQREAWCWGLNRSGQLGVGDTLPRRAPTRVPGFTGVAEIAAGASSTCARRTDGIVACWGSNQYAERASTESTNALTPSLVSGVPVLASLAAGAWHYCGIEPDGDALCWGRGDGGMLGSGSEPTGRCNFGTAACTSTPVPVAGGHRWMSLSGSDFFTCGLTTDGRAFCWGYGPWNALGTGDRVTRLEPAAVASERRFVRISTGHTHACALETDGTAWCWGVNSIGELGSGTYSSTPMLTPVRVAGDRRFVAIEAGDSFTCALDELGRIWCWGGGIAGRGGPGWTAGASAVPVRIGRAR